MEWKPNKYIAALLGLFTQFFAMLYVVRPKWAIFYFILPLAIFIGEFSLKAPWLPNFSLVLILAVVCAIHAFRIAAGSSPIMARPWYSRLYGIAAIYLAYFVLVYAFRSFVYEPFRIPAESMYPTINVGSYVVVEKYGYGNYGTYGNSMIRTGMTRQLSRGDIVVFDSPENTAVRYVKRVVGKPGDSLVFKEQRLIVNGVPVLTDDNAAITSNADEYEHHYTLKREHLDNQSYLVAYVDNARDTDFEVIVPERSYFVLGDNRDNSRDSRYLGFVPESNVVGRVVQIISP